MVLLARLANREPSPRRSGEKVPKADEGLSFAQLLRSRATPPAQDDDGLFDRVQGPGMPALLSFHSPDARWRGDDCLRRFAREEPGLDDAGMVADSGHDDGDVFVGRHEHVDDGVPLIGD